MDEMEREVRDWWQTKIIEMEPGIIRYYGYPIEQLIGNVTFPQMIWLMLRGELPSPAQAKLLDAVLMSAVDHGPQAPSIAIARMAVTCGIGLNSAMATAVNVLGDVHGGAGEQAVEFYLKVAERIDSGKSLQQAVKEEMDVFFASGQRFIPGFGHRFHPLDPRAPRLLELVDEAARAGTVSGRFAHIGRQVEQEVKSRKGRPVPMNIDGATAVIYGELEFPPALARGLFCLSRSVGILAHAWEQTLQGGRNKGPIPRTMIWSYDGPALRPVPVAKESP